MIAVLGFAKLAGGKSLNIVSKGMSYKEVTKIISKVGWEFVRNGNGSHMIWKAPNGTTFPIPNHGSKSLSDGLINSINKLNRN